MVIPNAPQERNLCPIFVKQPQITTLLISQPCGSNSITPTLLDDSCLLHLPGTAWLGGPAGSAGGQMALGDSRCVWAPMRFRAGARLCQSPRLELAACPLGQRACLGSLSRQRRCTGAPRAVSKATERQGWRVAGASLVHRALFPKFACLPAGGPSHAPSLRAASPVKG